MFFGTKCCTLTIDISKHALSLSLTHSFTYVWKNHAKWMKKIEAKEEHLLVDVMQCIQTIKTLHKTLALYSLFTFSHVYHHVHNNRINICHVTMCQLWGIEQNVHLHRGKFWGKRAWEYCGIILKCVTLLFYFSNAQCSFTWENMLFNSTVILFESMNYVCLLTLITIK